jgi:hypothetical protein
MAAMSGTIEQISTKEVNTKFGPKPTYSFKCDGNWIKHGFKNPNVNVGDVVEFDGESGTYGVETKSVRIVSKGSGPAVSVTSSASSPRPSGGSYGNRIFPIPPLHGDRSIVRQNALARATELYVGARGGKPFDLDVDETCGLVIGIARKFEAYTAGDLDLAAATEEAKSE